MTLSSKVTKKIYLCAWLLCSINLIIGIRLFYQKLPEVYVLILCATITLIGLIWVKKERIFFEILTKFILIVQKFTKKEKYLLFDNLYSLEVESNDAYSLFLYLQKEGVPAVYFARKDSDFYNKNKEKKNKDIYFLSETGQKRNVFLTKAFFHLLSARAVLTSFGNLDKETTKFLVHNKSINYIYLDHGVVFFKISFFLNNYMSSKKYNYCVVSNEYEAQIFKQYGWHENQLIKVGLPRWDLLNTKENKAKKIFVFFTWRQTFLHKSNFRPAFRETSYYKKIESFITNQRLKNILVENKIELCVAFHHALKNQCKVDMSFKNFQDITIVEMGEISRYVQEADILVTDYSSLAFDFFFLEKPVLFYRVDEDDNTLEMSDRVDLNFAKSLDSKMFNVFYNEELLIDKLKFYIENDFLLENENLNILNDKFFTKKEIRRQIFEKIEKL